jgi:hypothetical protein
MVLPPAALGENTKRGENRWLAYMTVGWFCMLLNKYLMYLNV